MDNKFRKRWNIWGFVASIPVISLFIGLVFIGRLHKASLDFILNILWVVCILLFVIVIIRNIKLACKKSIRR